MCRVGKVDLPVPRKETRPKNTLVHLVLGFCQRFGALNPPRSLWDTEEMVGPEAGSRPHVDCKWSGLQHLSVLSGSSRLLQKTLHICKPTCKNIHECP